MIGKLLRIWVVICLAALLVLTAASASAWRWLNASVNMPSGFSEYIVEKGASLYSVAQDFHRAGLIRWPVVWVYYARIVRRGDIKAGEYRFDDNESPITILAKINRGDVVQHQLTLVEGNTFKDFLDRIHAHKKIVKTFEYQDRNLALQSAGIHIDHVEGWFYPDTYQFTAGDSDISILLRAHEKMRSVLSREWAGRADQLPYQSPYEALVMASIVEKETGVAHERSEIAGVFVRRLGKKMRLQTDPTVIYGMGENYRGNITRHDLRTPTPYNTYVIKGLPPTPIAMPGEAAIHATLHPQPGDSLFFVAKGDGTHHFSNTVEEHNKAVIRYQKNRRRDYRSSPGESN